MPRLRQTSKRYDLTSSFSLQCVAMSLTSLSFAASARVELLADVHLHHDDKDTFAAWQRATQNSKADALIFLGDIFELWVGDDWGLKDPFALACATVLQKLSLTRQLYFMPGNRDFLLGRQFAQHCGMQLLADPCVLQLGGRRILLTHGDAWVVADVAYQNFRRMARSSQWQRDFFSRPLSERIALGAKMRAQSQAAQAGRSDYDDLDMAVVCAQLRQHQADTLIHGHTHRPSHDTLAPGLQRWVLSDWDAKGGRGDLLHIQEDGITRISSLVF
jgi:UDP-2,3-diacylglucosamine hydrolase